MIDIHKFSIPEMYSNSKGKTSLSLVCAHMLVITGCIMGIRGAFYSYADSMLQGLAFAGLGAGLLGIRRWTPDKEISEKADPANEKPA
jgi:hypothetical protein